MSIKRKLLRSSSLNLLDHGVKMAAMLLVTPFLVRSLGMQDYGTWLLLNTAVSFLNLLDGGITLSGTRFYSRCVGKDSEGDVKGAQILTSLCWLYHRMGGLCLLGTLVLCLSVARFAPTEYETSAQLVLGALGLGSSLRFFLRVHLVVLKSHLRYDLIVLASLIKVFVQTALVLALLANGYGLVVLALAQLATEFLDQALVVFFSRRTTAIQTKASPDMKFIRELLGFSTLVLINLGSHQLRRNSAPFIIAHYVGMSSVPLFGMAQRLIMMLWEVVNTALGGILVAGFSQVAARSDMGDVRNKFLESLRFSVPLALFGATGLFSLGPAFLRCWLGPEFEQAGWVLWMLLIPYTIWLMQFPAESLFISLGKHGLMARLGVFAALGNVALCVGLAIPFGLHGVISGIVIEMTLAYALGLPWMLHKALDLSLPRYFSLIAKQMLQLLPFLTAAVLLSRHFDLNNYSSLIGAGLLEGSCFALGVIFAVLTPAEKRALVSRFMRFKTSS